MRKSRKNKKFLLGLCVVALPFILLLGYILASCVYSAYTFPYSYGHRIDLCEYITAYQSAKPDLLFKPTEVTIELYILTQVNPEEWTLVTSESSNTELEEFTIIPEELDHGMYKVIFISRDNLNREHKHNASSMYHGGCIDDPTSGIEYLTTWCDNKMVLGDDIRNLNIQEGDTITPSFEITGEIEGGMCFEGECPLFLVDGADNIVYTGRITLKGNWMTEDLVPFKGEIIYDGITPGAADGDIIIRNSNPSGFSEDCAYIRIPVILGS